jgi:hypothetical protein
MHLHAACFPVDLRNGFSVRRYRHVACAVGKALVNKLRNSLFACIICRLNLIKVMRFHILTDPLLPGVAVGFVRLLMRVLPEHISCVVSLLVSNLVSCRHEGSSTWWTRRPRTEPCSHNKSFITPSTSSVAGIAIGYGLDDWGVGVRVPVGSRIFSLRRPDQLWGPPNHISTGYRGLFPRGVKLTTQLQLVPRWRKCGSIHPLPHTPSWRSV